MPHMPKHKRKEKGNWLKNKKDAKLYNSAKWRKQSAAFKMANPVCMVHGCTRPSAYTDHIKPVSEGGAFWDSANWQALCKHHNASKTAKQKYDRSSDT